MKGFSYMKNEKQIVKTYKLNNDFTIECVMGESMSVRVLMLSLPWEPVVEEVSGIVDKNEGNQIFKKMVAKYREDAYSSVIIRSGGMRVDMW